MQLDKFTDYALRILVVLAVRSPERLSTSTISKIYDLSENHLSKVASELVKYGFIASTRGRAGGLTLAMSPEDISIGAVVRALKGDTPVVECFGSNKSCRILPACGLRTPMQEAQEAFFAALDPYSLHDISQAKTSLTTLLTP
jgi:Rrf2 family nitric oxide-sensitive transcriptional repressor